MAGTDRTRIMKLNNKAAAVGLLTLGKLGVNTYHPFEKYITKPQTQSIMFDWARKNPQPKSWP